ncbi:MAG: hypothetical protein O7G87_18230 [bacterium]|nr:hypothetical protein [bacterium]
MAISSQHEAVLDAAPVRERLTLRAFVLGLLTIAGMCLYATYFGRNLMKSFLPITTLLPLVLWIGINTVLKLVVPQWALSRTEVMGIFGMVWMVGTAPAVGWGGYLITDISAPAAFSSPENRFWEVVGPYMPRWLFFDRGTWAVERLYSGLGPGEAIPWDHWTVPLFWWFAGTLALVMAGFFASVLFYKQWLEHERLTFPLATVPLELLREEPGSRLPAVFRQWAFWAGFACTGAVLFWNIAGYFVLSLPRITVYDHYLTKAVFIGRDFPTLYLRVQPLLMGLSYLCPLNILLSFWVFFVVNVFKQALINRTGFTVGLQGQAAASGEIRMLEAHGALFFLVVWSVWVARGHLKETFRKAISGLRSEDDGAPVSYRTAWLGFLAAFVFLLGWMMGMGIGLVAALLQLLLLFVIYVGVAKYSAATGFVFLSPQGQKGGPVMKALLGTANFTASDLTGIMVVNRGGLAAHSGRMLSIPAIPHFFRLLQQGLGRRFLVVVALPGALLVAYLVSCGAQLYLCYTEGGLNAAYMYDWTVMLGQVGLIEGTEPTYFDPQKLLVWLFGVGEAGLLTLLSARFASWPIHPVGLAFPHHTYGFAIFLVWLVKSLTLRFGGVGLYRRSLPFWYGVVVGYLVGVGTSSVVDAIWFPGSGHWAHGW